MFFDLSVPKEIFLFIGDKIYYFSVETAVFSTFRRNVLQIIGKAFLVLLKLPFGLKRLLLVEGEAENAVVECLVEVEVVGRKEINSRCLAVNGGKSNEGRL